MISDRLRLALQEVWGAIRPHRRALAFGLFLMLISRASALILPASMKVLIDDVIGKHDVRLFHLLIEALLLGTILQSVSSFALTRLLGSTGAQAVNELRKKVQAHITLLPVSFFDANKTGALITRIMSDVEAVRNLVAAGLLDLIGALFTALVAMILLLYISPLMTGIAISLLVAYALVVQRAFRWTKPIFIERSRVNAEVTGRLTESLGGVRVVKGYNAEATEASIFAAGCRRLYDISYKALTASAAVSLAGSIAGGLAMVIITYTGAAKIFSGTLTLGEFATFMTLSAFLVTPISAVSGFGNQLTEALAGLERVRAILNEKSEHDNPARVIKVEKIGGQVRFDNVSFAYEGRENVLHGISFDIEPGTVTALVGPSGAGKSTIIGLIAAFYTPDSGTVYVDGMDLSKVVLNSYRHNLGVVFQDTFLFDGTIRENVAFAKAEATEAEIISACRSARVDEFAERFEDKYDTLVGERGVKLSGGQKQRVSIARAILANPSILILDEATSSLDSESEALIQESLQRLMRDRTSFVIAHRLSTVHSADQILVLEGGHIVERGNHDALYAARGRYHELYTKQFREGAALFPLAAVTSSESR